MNNKCGFVPTDILVPVNADMTKWSCVACDQYTSEREYWETVEKTVGDAPSTLRLMLPEVYLSQTDTRSPKIGAAMRDYLDTGIFKTLENCFIYVERTLADGNVRQGLVGAIDLEIYDYSKDSVALCRPTEATVTSRLPARVEIRRSAPIEMPHIMMLIDDKAKSVIEPFAALTYSLEKVYDFTLMQGGGHIRGYKVDGKYAELAADTIEALYNSSADEHPMLFAMGDGNHSLAAAKSYYEQLKGELGDAATEHPARYALVELVNLFDDALTFEPIHRVFFGADVEKLMSELSSYGGLVKGEANGQRFDIIIGGKCETYTFTAPTSGVTVGTVQNFLDAYEKANGGETDYIHGDDVVKKLVAEASDRIGFIVGGIEKDDFFNVVKKDGIFPRKTFSMGHAHDKRFYLECRKIIK